MLASLATILMHSFFQKRKAPPVIEETPSEIPELNGADVAAVFYGQRIGGDFYEFVRVSPVRVLFGLLDLAGQRDENRSILGAAKETFRSSGQRLFSNSDLNEADAMAELCIELNLAIMKAASGVRSCPAFLGCFNEDVGTVCYTNAGHTPGLLRDEKGISELPATGLPLGLFSHTTREAPTVGIARDGIMMVVSRGVVEGYYKGEEFGLGRVKEVLQTTHATSARELGLTILDGVKQFMRTPPTHNDVTALVLTRL